LSSIAGGLLHPVTGNRVPNISYYRARDTAPGGYAAAPAAPAEGASPKEQIEWERKALRQERQQKFAEEHIGRMIF